jgi:hypothetical protein
MHCLGRCMQSPACGTAPPRIPPSPQVCSNATLTYGLNKLRENSVLMRTWHQVRGASSCGYPGHFVCLVAAPWPRSAQPAVFKRVDRTLIRISCLNGPCPRSRRVVTGAWPFPKPPLPNHEPPPGAVPWRLQAALLWRPGDLRLLHKRPAAGDRLGADGRRGGRARDQQDGHRLGHGQQVPVRGCADALCRLP